MSRYYLVSQTPDKIQWYICAANQNQINLSIQKILLQLISVTSKKEKEKIGDTF